MRIAVISDQHFGFDWNGERQDDPFRNCREAFEAARDADLILLPGDLFDTKVPKQEVLARAIDLFSIFDETTSSVTIDAEHSDTTASFRGTPIVAIHGTHERRTADHVNPVELLEKMGYLVHLHNERIVFEQDNERVAIHGMSGVPERYAPQVLDRFGPQPIDGAFNLLMLHQSIDQLVYTDPDHETLSLERLPEGFDYIVNGHIHWRNLELKDDDKPVILPGSTITTQLNQIEAERDKGFLWIDTEDGLTFQTLEDQRNVIYLEIDVADKSSTAIREIIEDELADRETERRPLVRVRLTGETDAAISGTEIEQYFHETALMTVSDETKTPDGETTETAFDHTEESIQDHGTALLEERVEAGGVGELVDLLADADIEAARTMITDLVEQEANRETGTESEETVKDTLEQFVDDR